MERIEQIRMGATRLWRNPPVRRLAVLLAGTAIAAALFVWLFTFLSTERIQQEWLAQQSALLGRLSAADPALAEQMARLLADPRQLSPQEAQQGRELAASHGLTAALGTRLSPVLEAYETRTAALLGAGLFLLLAALAVLLLREYRRSLKDIRRLAVALENAVKHDLPMPSHLHEEGEVGLLAASVQDLAVRLRETIGQLRREKDFMKDTVADISHQLKTPLSSLIIYVELLHEGNLNPSDAKEFLETCRRELDRMEWLIQTLLKLARLEADAVALQIRPASLAETVDKACDAVRRLAAERNVEIAMELPFSKDVTVPHDANWLSEALANLLKNGVEHSPPGGAVRVSCELTPVFLRLYIDDQGPGIDPKDMPHIFRKFYRSSAGGSGVGLGLPLAKTIAERHGGMLSAAARSEGGTRFTLTLPLQPLPPSHSYKSVSTGSSRL